MPDELYFQLDYENHGYLSSTFLKTALGDPVSYQYSLDNPLESSDAMNFGSLVHCYYLEPERFKTDYLLAPAVDRRTKAGKAEYEAFQHQAKGKVIYSQKDSDTIKAIDKYFPSNLRRWLDEAEKELTCLVDLPFGKVRVKFDAISQGSDAIFDVKTTSKFDRFKSEVKYRFYNMQARLYQLAANKYFGGEFTFYWIVIETVAPFRVTRYQCHVDMLQRGGELINEAIANLNYYQESGVNFDLPEIAPVIGQSA